MKATDEAFAQGASTCIAVGGSSNHGIEGRCTIVNMSGT